MSKPDPSITANLLKSVLAKPDAPHENDPKRAAKPVSHGEGHAAPAAKPPKPKAAKHNPSGQGHMRSSNRGK